MLRRIARLPGRWAWTLGLGLALAGLGLGGGTAFVRAADPLVLDGDFEANMFDTPDTAMVMAGYENLKMNRFIQVVNDF